MSDRFGPLVQRMLKPYVLTKLLNTQIIPETTHLFLFENSCLFGLLQPAWLAARDNVRDCYSPAQTKTLTNSRAS